MYLCTYVCKYVWRYIHAKVGMKYVGVQICTYARLRKTLKIELCIYVSMCLCVCISFIHVSMHLCVHASTHQCVFCLNASVYQ